MTNSNPILITGGAGYIGSHAVLALVDAGRPVVVVDNLVYGHRDVVEHLPGVTFVEGDIGDRTLMDQVFTDHPIAAVMHFSAYAYVGESVQNPAKYYQNNVAATLNLLDAMIAADIKHFVFSSTCATYGMPGAVPITEDMPQHPINPYGRTKLMVERILDDYDQAYGLKSVIFRYFNAAGADPQGRSGENHDPETHLVPLVLEAVSAHGPHGRHGKQTGANSRILRIFGTDYPTRDGTCVRDYIHVTDLAQAHLLGLEFLTSDNSSERFNLGNGTGYSVRDVIDTARQITGCDIPAEEAPRRPGDPPELIGSADKARSVLGWAPQFPDLETIVSHAWEWSGKSKSPT